MYKVNPIFNQTSIMKLPLYQQIANFILSMNIKYPYGGIPIGVITNKFGISKDELKIELSKLNSKDSSLYSQVISVLNI